MGGCSYSHIPSPTLPQNNMKERVLKEKIELISVKRMNAFANHIKKYIQDEFRVRDS